MKILAALFILLLAIAVGFVSAALSAWALMCVIGLAHHVIDSRIPAFGFWQVFIVIWALSIVKNAVSPAKSAS